ncbi:MAG: 2-phospho-L-lactate transferase [Candidatus Bathyarchaeota archaeon]|jgi:LPPG:FO 2-phospho-L-lactate transferase|nr:MAG: 2-phospho-L-lactate transferase [Candidatus Bathyarchaeota archaeon]
MKQTTCLAGGIGAAKFLQGLVEIIPPEKLTIIVNTSDDIEMHGLHVSPDPDIIMYTLAGIVDEGKGWGMENDTFNCLNMLQKYGIETWFKLGDKDLATHIYRTQLLRSGLSLEEVTQRLCQSLKIGPRVLPMTNSKVVPQVITEAGKMHFEEYFVKRGAVDKVLDVILEGTQSANPASGVIESILDAEGIIVCPSNPIVSIGPIIAVNGVREALRETKAKVAAISPIVGGATIKGPADKLMEGLGLEASAFSVAALYKDFLDIFILDEVDKNSRMEIEELGIETIVTNTIMRSLEDKIELAKLTVEALN